MAATAIRPSVATPAQHRFARSGWHRTERLGFDDVKIERGSDRVSWQFGEQQLISQPNAQPPLWQAKGKIAGLGLDLAYRQMGKPIR